jgi:1-deoxy-D-xylulose-5-phosphate reductoisomerase
MRKKIAVLGCTGSIGSTALKIIRSYLGEFEVSLLANGSDIRGLKKLIGEFSPDKAYCGTGFLFRGGEEKPFDKDFLGREEAYADTDIVVNGISGLAGLAPTLAAIRAGKIIATANKESIVCGGSLIKRALEENPRAELRPVDSEHSTVWQCLGDVKNVKSIILTASGGAFRDYTRGQIENARAADALRHPNWVMGKKVTVDCATLMNKGMEIIEAKRLFGIDDVRVVLHRESIVHSLVEMKDGALIAGLSNPDMEIPIQYALFYPERRRTSVKRFSLSDVGRLSFGRINEELFPCFGLCKKAAEYGDYAGTVMNAADEIAVKAYLCGEIGFYGISDCVEKAFEKFGYEGRVGNEKELYRIDGEAREYILRTVLEKKC